MQKKNVVIVGAGTAGLVIANNLQDNFNVKVFDKSIHKTYPVIYKIPMMIGILFRKHKKYISKTEIYSYSERKIPFFESNLLGGASVINGCVHTIGIRASWRNVLEKFKFSIRELDECYARNYTKNYETGKINLRLSKVTEIDAFLLEALKKIDISAGDIERSDRVGCGQISNTVGRLFRTSVLSLLIKRKYSLFLDRKVTALKFSQSGKLIGVVSDNKLIDADYVVIASGTIGTNMLMLEEIKNGYISLEHMETIGKNIQDHVNLRVNVVTNRKIGSFNEIERSFVEKMKIFFSHILHMPNLLMGTGATTGIQLDLDGDGKVDTRIHLVQFTESGRHGSDGNYFGSKPGFSFSITPILPYSKGVIENEKGVAVIKPGYLSDERDIDLMLRAIDFCINLTKINPLSECVQEIMDLDLIRTNPKKYIAENIYSGHHLIGGTGDIINSNFQVKSVSNLYICDASIFQEYVASNIHASVVLLADLFSRRFIDINK
jgi:hypothetical protein